jgi:F420-non-reducing hydrogenase iron-sulfur subunit
MDATLTSTDIPANRAVFEPRIVAFLCTWCSYAGADLAGTSRLHYPPNVMPIRVMCPGRVDAEFIIRAFKEGADAVGVFGCHPGDCHYISGNHKTMARIPLLKKTLEQFGIEPERLQLHWVSASEARRFAEIISRMTSEIRELGPLELENSES